MQYDQALALATRIAPQDISKISVEYGRQLELEGKYGEALEMYQKALEESYRMECSEEERAEHDIICSGLLMKMLLKTGDIFKGMSLIQNCNDTTLLSECGYILWELNQYKEAANVFESAGQWDMAVKGYIQGITPTSRCNNLKFKIGTKSGYYWIEYRIMTYT
jgi:WD repeat-containing protein 19